ncbi:Uncharacterized protein Adt_35111 [Abeliophyllum distichum]|uniref:Uncharacterized protein n=1 Tax=Abeliophyllum distichum TaxID=126358 RepID=A0ABD1QDT3_9LAMI
MPKVVLSSVNESSSDSIGESRSGSSIQSSDRSSSTKLINRRTSRYEGVEYDLNVVLNSIPLATDDEGPVKDSAPSKRMKLSDKDKGSVSGKEVLTTTNVEKGGSRGRYLKDVPINQPDDDPLDDETTFHDIHFPPTNANKTLNWFEVAH